MQAKDLRQLSREEIATRVKELEQEYYSWLDEIQAGKESNYAKLRFLKQDIARAKTVLREKQA